MPARASEFRVPRSSVKPNLSGAGRRFALVVGCSRYTYGGPNDDLSYSLNDVKLVGDALEQRGYMLRTLHDEASSATLLPTRANVVRKLQAIVRIAKENDLIFIHFSCHGKLVRNRPHLILQDTRMATEEEIERDGLALSTLLEILHSGRNRWLALFFDACHVGLGFDEHAAQMAQKREQQDGGFALLAGSTSFQKTQESHILGAGVFSKALADGLKGAAADPDGRVMFSSLANHVKRQVRDWKMSNEGKLKFFEQWPVMRIECADPEIAPPREDMPQSGQRTKPFVQPVAIPVCHASAMVLQ